MAHEINILVSTFPGLGLPPTLALHLPPTSTTEDLTSALSERLPPVNYRLLLTTASNKLVHPTSAPLTTLLSSEHDMFVSLRLSAPLCGGKGGFGSQLRAAGGRMSSRKSRNSAESSGSNRNLDGRRLRTVTEAKALAEYLAVKPEMEKREKEERRRRWEQVVEAAERREEEIKNGSGKGKGRVNEEWVEQKEEAESKTREAVLAALQKGEISSVLGTVGESESEGSGEASAEGSESEDEIPAEATSDPTVAGAKSRTFFGWDDEDEDMSDEHEDEEEAALEAVQDVRGGKGKGRAIES